MSKIKVIRRLEPVWKRRIEL